MAKNVLVIDDERTMRHLISAALSKTGYSVDQAENFTQALDYLNLNRYDLITCDYLMPEMNGADFIHALKEKSIAASSKILLITAVANDEIPSDIRFDGFLEKPFDLLGLKSCVNTLIGVP